MTVLRAYKTESACAMPVSGDTEEREQKQGAALENIRANVGSTG
jgi:hypothetical protein